MRRALMITAVLLISSPVPALAQEGYPGTTTTTTAQTSVTVTSAGTLRQGEGFTNEACGFVVGSTVSITLNGTAAGTDTVEGDGCARQPVRLLEDGVAMAGGGGALAVAAPALMLAQTTTTPMVSIEGRQVPARVGTNELSVSGTGSNGVARTVTTRFEVAAGPVPQRTLPVTGAAVARWSAAAALLIAVGALIVVADRRRGRRAAEV